MTVQFNPTRFTSQTNTHGIRFGSTQEPNGQVAKIRRMKDVVDEITTLVEKADLADLTPGVGRDKVNILIIDGDSYIFDTGSSFGFHRTKKQGEDRGVSLDDRLSLEEGITSSLTTINGMQMDEIQHARRDRPELDATIRRETDELVDKVDALKDTLQQLVDQKEG